MHHTFYTYSFPSKPSTVQVGNSKVQCHFRYFFLLSVGENSNMGGWRWARGWFLKNERGKCMDALGQVIYTIPVSKLSLMPSSLRT